MPAQVLPTEPVSQARGRALIGWLSEHEAITMLLGRMPAPADDVSVLEPTARSARNAVARRAPHAVSDPVVDQHHERLESVAARPEVAASFAGVNWRTAMVDLRHVLALQKVIVADGLDERVPSTVSVDQLFDLCLPPLQATLAPHPTMDGDGKGMTLSSVNPNLRVVGANFSAQMVPPGPGLPPIQMLAMTVLAYVPVSYLVVARYRGRCFVRDGNHRAAGLVRRGCYVAPCVLMDARNFNEVMAPGPGILTDEILFGDRPPTVADFWDDAVSHDVRRLAIRKVVRVRPDELDVPR